MLHYYSVPEKLSSMKNVVAISFIKKRKASVKVIFNISYQWVIFKKKRKQIHFS